MDQDVAHTNTPRSNARRTERDARTLDSPERRRIPAGPRLDLPPQPFPLPLPAAPVGPVQFNDPFQNNFAPAPAPVYNHLPAHLAQAVAQLPPLQPVNRARRRGAAPAHLAQAAAQLPALQPVNRVGSGPSIYANQNNNWMPVHFQPADPPVSLIIYIFIMFI